jgi:hypothetical protein
MVKTLIVLSLLSVGSAFTTVRSSVPRARLQMGLDPVLAKSFPRDFKTIPKGTDYGTGTDEKLNNDVESRRLDYLEKDLFAVLKEAVATKQRPMFTTALIAGDAVILDALHKTGLLSKVPVIFVDTFTLFPESLAHLREVEAHYGFKSKIYNAVDCKDQEDYYSKYVLGWCGLGCDAIPCADRLVCAYVRTSLSSSSSYSCSFCAVVGTAATTGAPTSTVTTCSARCTSCLSLCPASRPRRCLL